MGRHPSLSRTLSLPYKRKWWVDSLTLFIVKAPFNAAKRHFH